MTTASASLSGPIPPDARTEERARWMRAWRASDREEQYRVTRIEGRVPREISGTLYRNGPSQKVLPLEGYEALHLFDGDGLVHAFRFDDGRVDYTGRFVRDEAFLAEQELGPSRLHFFNFRVENPADEEMMRRSPNTNVVHHAGRLFAMTEAAPPFELDPRTLESRGWYAWRDPMLGMSTSAHPRIDGRTGQMVIHGYQPFPPFVQLYVIEPDGTCSLAENVETPYSVMMHDLAITEHHVVLPLCPVIFELKENASFRDCLRWEPERGLRFGIRSREAGSPIRWFEAETPGFLFHPGNAYERDGKIFMDACTYQDGAGLLDCLATFRAGRVGPGATAVPFLYEFDLATGACHERQLDDRGAEFPRLDDRLVGHENRYGYAVMGTPDAIGPGPKRIVRYDRTGGPNVFHDFGAGHYPGEPVFVPRHEGAAEDDGFVLTCVYDGPADASYLAVLDAGNLDAAPLAKAHLHHRVPMGFHGNFAAGVL